MTVNRYADNDSRMTRQARNTVAFINICAIAYINLFQDSNEVQLETRLLCFGIVNGVKSLVWAYSFVYATNVFRKKSLKLLGVETITALCIMVSLLLAHVQIQYATHFSIYWSSMACYLAIEIGLFILFRKSMGESQPGLHPTQP